MNKWHKSALVILGAVIFSTVAIQASDILRNIDGNLVGSAIESGNVCGEGAEPITLGSGTLCVDLYEASAGTQCPVSVLETSADTQQNMNVIECTTQSESEVLPWNFVSLTQAQQLCARSGKRLPSADEWYNLALAMGNQTTCVTNGSSPTLTGVSDCVTQSGIHDMVGNVWEWIDADVSDGSYNNRTLPESGFVHLVDSDGVVVQTGSVSMEEYGSDYAQTSQEGVRGVVRGGYYGGGDDSGIHAQNLAVPLDLRTVGVGFRCVKSL